MSKISDRFGDLVRFKGKFWAVKNVNMQLFKKHASAHTCFSKNQSYSQLFYTENVRSVSECVFVLLCVTPPTDNLTNTISAPRVARDWKMAFRSHGSQQTSCV